MATGYSVATKPVERTSSPKPVFVQGPLNVIRSIKDAVTRRAHELFLKRGGATGNDHHDWYAAERELLHPVHLFLGDCDDAYFVVVEVPGFDAEHVIINIEPNCLTIAGQRQATGQRCRGRMLLSDHCADQFLRAVQLNEEVDVSRASALLTNGILEIQMPKSAWVFRTNGAAQPFSLVRAKDYKRWTYAIVQLLDGRF